MATTANQNGMSRTAYAAVRDEIAELRVVVDDLFDMIDEAILAQDYVEAERLEDAVIEARERIDSLEVYL